MNLDTLQSSEAAEMKLQEARPVSDGPGPEATAKKWIWNPDGFAREQLRGLVQRIFLSQATARMRQVVISAADSRTDVSDICLQVGEVLSQETAASVVVVAGDVSGLPAGCPTGDGLLDGQLLDGPSLDVPRRSALATRVYGNLWITPGLRRTVATGAGPRDIAGNQRREMIGSAAWYSRLCDFRREFEYSILEGPAAGESSDSAIAAQAADGMILVLTAHGTRRATVHRIQETLKSTQTHLLGTILAERRFPIPEGIYRRL